MSSIHPMTIGEVADVYDGPHATPKKTADGPIYLGIDAISDRGTLLPNEFAHLSEDDFAQWTKRVTPQPSDIVFSYEATLGRYAMIPEGFRGCLGRRLGIVRVTSPDVNPKWLYYYFLTPAWSRFVSNHTFHGSTVNRISVEEWPTYGIPFPDKETQDSQVAVLSSIDEKIENNHRLMAELETAVRLVYDEWFVRFDFPDEQGRPYRSSGGKMVWNDELKREIPEEWRVSSLANLCCFKNGVNYDKDSMSGIRCRIVNVRNITSSTLFINPSELDEIELPASLVKRYSLRCDDILIARSGTPGAVRLIDRPKGIIFCGFIICCTPLDSDYRSYLAMALKRLEGTTATVTGGSILKNVSQDTLKSVLVVYPPKEIVEQFNTTINVIMHQIVRAEKESWALGNLRDWLLPMLMNGQVKVG